MADNKLANMLSRIWTKAPALDKNEAPNLYHRSPRMNPVRVIAKAAATVEYGLYSRKALRKDADAADPIDEHELYELLENPCPTFRELDGWTLRYLTFAHYKLVGEFFWLKVRDPRGRIMALLPIPAAWVPKKPTVSDHNFLIYPYGVIASSALNVPADDVVWFKDPDLLDPYSNGRGSSEAIFDEIQADEYAAKYQKNFFFNDASPKFAITAEGANEQQIKQIKQNFMAKLAGYFHAKEPAVLTTKGATIQKLTETMVELDMIESRKYLRDECLQNYQIPPEIYGIIENSNRSTIDSAYYLFNKNVLSYDLAVFERVVTGQLCHEYDLDLCLRHDNIITEDEELALKVYDLALKNGTITANQFNTRFRLPEQKDGDVYVVPMSLMRVPVGGYVAPDPTPPAPPAPKPDDDATLEIEDEPPAKMLKVADDPAIEARKVAIWKSFDAKAVSVEEPFRKATRKIADVQRGKVNAAVSSAMRKSATEQSLNQAISSVFTDDTDRAVKQTLAPAWRASLEAGHDHGADTLGLKSASGVTTKAADAVYNEYFNKWIEEHGLEKAKEINETTKDGLLGKLQAVLSASIADGDGLGSMIEKLSAACNGVYDNMSTTRAELIARTESASTVNAGAHITYASEGITHREWLSVRDGRTRRLSEGDAFDHSVMDGKIVDIDKPFIVSGEELMYPGDPSSASAGNICNCRCSIAPVLD